MKFGKTSPVVLVFLGLCLLGCIGGAGFGTLTFTQYIRQEVANRRSEKQARDDLRRQEAANRRSEKQAQDDMTASLKQLVSSGKLGKRPDFPDTAAGRLSAHIYDYLVARVERQEEFEKLLVDIGWDWVLGADAFKSKASVEKSLKKLVAIRKATAEFYEGMGRDTIKLQETLKQEAGADRDGQDFMAGVDFLGPTSGLVAHNQMHEVIKLNHNSIEGMLNCLLRWTGKYTVGPDGAVTARVSDVEIQKYNAFVSEQRRTFDEINRLDNARKTKVKGDLGIL